MTPNGHHVAPAAWSVRQQDPPQQYSDDQDHWAALAALVDGQQASLEQYQQREQEVTARHTNRQLEGAYGLLDQWSLAGPPTAGDGASHELEPAPVPAHVPTATAGAPSGSRVPLYDFNKYNLPWQPNTWTEPLRDPHSQQLRSSGHGTALPAPVAGAVNAQQYAYPHGHGERLPQAETHRTPQYSLQQGPYYYHPPPTTQHFEQNRLPQAPQGPTWTGMHVAPSYNAPRSTHSLDAHPIEPATVYGADVPPPAAVTASSQMPEPSQAGHGHMPMYPHAYSVQDTYVASHQPRTESAMQYMPWAHQHDARPAAVPPLPPMVDRHAHMPVYPSYPPLEYASVPQGSDGTPSNGPSVAGTPASGLDIDLPTQSRKSSIAGPGLFQSSARASNGINFAAANAALQDGSAISSAKRVKNGKSAAAAAAAASGAVSTSSATAQEGLVIHPHRRGSKRTVAEEYVTCTECGNPIAKFILRGKYEELALPHVATYECWTCYQTKQAAANGETPETDTETAARTEPAASTSTESDTKTPKQTALVRTTSSFRKRHNKRTDASSKNAVTACDVCLRDIAAGAISATDGRSRIDFHIEVVCSSCDDKYRRCSDCGGGGGLRLGVGKWRSKQLFRVDRKTCKLSHTRLGALSDMTYNVHFVGDIPADEVDDVSEICGKIFANTLFASICIPEVFEQQQAIAKSYIEVEAMAKRGWGALDPLLRDNIESSQSIRRYLAVRSCTPNPRKGNASEPIERAHRNGVVLRTDKDLVGFVIAEWDMKLGSVFLAVVVPWAMGEVYDATTILIQTMFRQVEADREEINLERQRQSLAPLPQVDQTWTMMFFKRDSRMIQHLNKKRGFMFLEDFARAYPDVDLSQFPPTRPIYLPRERQQGWQVMVKRKAAHERDFFSVRRDATSADVGRKQKEQKARLRREQGVESYEE